MGRQAQATHNLGRHKTRCPGELPTGVGAPKGPLPSVRGRGGREELVEWIIAL